MKRNGHATVKRKFSAIPQGFTTAILHRCEVANEKIASMQSDMRNPWQIQWHIGCTCIVIDPRRRVTELRRFPMAESNFVFTGNDTTLRDQYFATFRRSEHLEPEKALLMAILEDAIHCYRKYRAARDRAGRERFREVEQWIMEEGDDWLFSFNNVCELLGLDPQFIRRGVRELSASPAEPERPRRRAGAHRHAA